MDILHDRADLQFKRDSEADISSRTRTRHQKLLSAQSHAKLSLDKETVEEWRQLVESVMIDFNFDGAVMQPRHRHPRKERHGQGRYKIPRAAGVIRVKITDVLSESWKSRCKMAKRVACRVRFRSSISCGSFISKTRDASETVIRI